MKKITLKKGQILQRNGDLYTKVYHVRSGLLRSYSIDQKGKEHIFMFAPEGWVIADAVSPNEPCDLFISAIEESDLTVFEKDVEDNPDIDRLINRLKALQKRILMLMSSSIIERYAYFVKTYPEIVERVPQKMIASYLGVTPEALSKAKRKWLQKHQ